jgi:hypothetical protein
MGMGMALFEYLSERGHLSKNSRILDIGSQNLYNATPENIRAFVEKYGTISDETGFKESAEKIAYFSTPRVGERTSYISELLDLTDIFYTSYDVCPALKTEIFDLNRERLPARYMGYFDVVLNLGTTEHVFNQLNSYEVMHDAVVVGGIFLHQVPSIGWTDHGYFCYHDNFFEDLAKANNYEIVDLWYSPTGVSKPNAKPVDVRDQTMPLVPHSATPAQLPDMLVNYNIHAVLRKVHDAPFCVGLELATSHSSLSQEISTVYGPQGRLAVGREPLQLQSAISVLKETISAEISQAMMHASQEALPKTIEEITQSAVITTLESYIAAMQSIRDVDKTRTVELAREVLRRVKTKVGM